MKQPDTPINERFIHPGNTYELLDADTLAELADISGACVRADSLARASAYRLKAFLHTGTQEQPWPNPTGPKGAV